MEVTILEAIRKSAEFLEGKGVENPRLQVEMMLEKILKQPRLQLYLQFETHLTEIQENDLRAWVIRRGQREPLQHLLGEVSFCGYPIQVNPEVLIPRPESEILAETAWNYLIREFRDSSVPLQILDFGTGSGCLAIAIAQNTDNVQVTALDASEKALKTAAKNLILNDLTDRIKLIESHGFDALNGNSRFDLIVSNPPYIPSHEIPNLEPEVRLHDPISALDGGSDGLDFYRILASGSTNHLTEEGILMMEFGDGQEIDIVEILQSENWIVDNILNDYTDRPRIIIAKRMCGSAMIPDSNP